MYTHFGSRGCGSAAIEVALERVQTPYRFVRASSWQPDAALGVRAAANPLHEIATLLLPDGTVLTENAAILIHLGLSFPASGILPAPTSKRAQSIRGLVFIAAKGSAAVGVSHYPQRWCAGGGGRAVEAVPRGVRRRLHGNWELFADVFPARPYLAGPQRGGLDFLAAACQSGRAPGRTCAWRERNSRRRWSVARRIPRVAPVFARHWPGEPPNRMVERAEPGVRAPRRRRRRLGLRGARR